MIHLHGVGGRTVKKLCLYDLGVVSALKPDVIIIEIGTIANRPKVVLRSNQYLTHVLELCPKAFSWCHMGFSNPTVSPYFPDGVHSNPQGQYSLYRSYQGAILKALRLL